MNASVIVLLLTATALAFSACTTAEGTATPSTTPSTTAPSFKATAQADRENRGSIVPYPFTTCAVIRKEFGAEGAKYRRVYKNHEVLLCCTPCLHAFDANPDPYMGRIIQAAAAKARGESVNSGW